MRSLLLSVVVFFVMAQSAVAQGLTFMEYNCENLFDCRHDSLKNDYEFLPDGERRWTFGRYWRKLNSIGRVIHQCGGEGENWRLPDLVALVEVENDSALFMLTRRSMLRGAGYRYVMTESQDPRGIDVALLYNPLSFQPLEHRSIYVTPTEGNHSTRDILYIKGVALTGDTLHVMVVHAPSRVGGMAATEPYRLHVAGYVTDIVDSLKTANGNANIIVAGDFNDYSSDRALRFITSHGMVEVSEGAVGLRHQQTKVCGTYKYQGIWDSLDHVFLSTSMAARVEQCYILDNRWMLENDVQGEYKPFRTFLGPVYHGGVSDHLPVVVRINAAPLSPPS